MSSTRRHRIRPPRRVLRPSLEESELEHRWTSLRDFMCHFLIDGETTTSLSFEELYRNAYILSLNIARADELHSRVTNFAKITARQISHQLQAHSDDQLLSSFIRRADHFTTVLPNIADVFMYLDHIRRDNGRPDPVTTTFRCAWDSFVFAQFEEDLRYATWRTVVTRPNDTIGHPVIQNIVDSFQIPRQISSPIIAGLRHVFLATRPLDGGPPLPDGILSLQHWGLVVEDGDNDGTLYEIAKLDLELGFPRQQRHFRLTAGWSRVHLGYTALSDKDIMKIVRTIGGLQFNYWITSDNCQKYCIRLFQCIRIPQGIQDVFQGLEYVPESLSMTVCRRRFREFEYLSYFRQTMASEVHSFPMSVETLTITFWLVFFWRRLWFALLTLRLFSSSPENTIHLLRRLPWLRMPVRRRLELIYHELHQMEEMTDLQVRVTEEELEERNVPADPRRRSRGLGELGDPER